MKKIIVKSIFILTLCFMIQPVLANAKSNHADTKFNFSFSFFNRTQYTNARPKYNATSAYIQMKKRSKKVSFSASVVDSNYKGLSKTWYYKIGTIDKGVYVANYAYEDRGYGVNIRIKATTDGAAFSTSGNWSPDSI